MIHALVLFATLNYHVVRHIPIGGEGGWDYLTVDAATHRLFVSHATEVDVIDVRSGEKLGAITGLSGVHGIAVASDLGRGFITNGRAGSVTVFDLKSLAKTAEWKTTGDNPDAILYHDKRLFTFNGRGHNSTVFDATNGNVVATIALDGKPEFPQTDGKRVFVNIEDKGEIAAIDLKSLTVAARWKVDQCDSPTGLAVDAKHRRLFTTCEETKRMGVVDADSGKTVASLPIGSGVDGAAFDAGEHVAFASSGAGELTVVKEISPSKYEVLATVPTMRGARTIALDPSTHHLFLPTAKFGTPAKEGERPPVVSGTFEVLEIAP